MKCKNCGRDFNDDLAYCWHCGSPREGQPHVEPKSKNRDNGWSTCFTVFLFIVVGIPASLLGGCLVVTLASNAIKDPAGLFLPFIGGALAFAVVLIALLVMVLRKR